MQTITMSYNATECKEAADTVRGAFYLVPSVLNTFSSVTTFLVFWLIGNHFGLRIYYHKNAQILIGINVASFLVLSIASIFAYGGVFINAFHAIEDCDFFFQTPNCSSLRRVFLFSLLLTTLTHVSLVLERAYATYKLGKYEHTGPHIGRTAGTLSIVFSMLIVYHITADEDKSEVLTNCLAFSSSASIGEGVYNMFKFQLALEMVTWIVYLYLMNHHRKTWLRESSEGNLGDRYQMTENETILRHLGPLVLTSSAIIAIYIVAASTARVYRPDLTVPHYKQLLSCIFIMPHNSLISMTLYYFLFKWAFQAKDDRMEETRNSPRNQKKSFHEQLSQYWNDSYNKKNPRSPRPFTDIGRTLDV